MVLIHKLNNNRNTCTLCYVSCTVTQLKHQYQYVRKSKLNTCTSYYAYGTGIQLQHKYQQVNKYKINTCT